MKPFPIAFVDDGGGGPRGDKDPVAGDKGSGVTDKADNSRMVLGKYTFCIQDPEG